MPGGATQGGFPIRLPKGDILYWSSRSKLGYCDSNVEFIDRWW